VSPDRREVVGREVTLMIMTLRRMIELGRELGWEVAVEEEER
jgi:hypothetical protein